MSQQSPSPSTGTPQDALRREPRVIIDHRYFPHIIDLIFSFLSYPGLLHWATVCKSWRDNAHDLLFHHVAVFEYRKETQTVDRGQENGDGREVGKSQEVLQPTERVLVRSRNLGWPGASIKLIAENNDDVKSMTPVYKDSAIVDCYYKSFEHDQAVGHPSHWPTRFQRLLNCRPTERWPTARFFTTDDLDWSDIVHFIDYVGGRYEFGPVTPGHPQTLAVTISCYSNPTLPRASLLSAVWPEFEDLMCDASRASNITIILKSFADQRPPAQPNFNCPPTDPMDIPHPEADRIKELGALGELVHDVVVLDFADSIKVVGLECIGSGESQTSYMQRICDIVESASDYLPYPPEYNGMPSVGTFFMFYTHEQYREEVGEERYRLLTVQ